MNTKILLIPLALLLVISLVVIGCPAEEEAPPGEEAPAPEEGVFHWRFQCPWGANDASYYVSTLGVARLIEEGSEGRIKVTTYSAGALVAGEELLSAVRAGSIEMGIDVCAAHGDLVPAANCVVPCASFISAEEGRDIFYNWGLFDLVQKGYAEAGLHLLILNPIGPNCWMAPFPIDSFDDFKGKKVYAFPQAVDIAKDLGAVPTEVPGFDIYSAITLGTIDFFMWTLGELEYGNFKEIVDYVVLDPIVYPGACSHFVSQKAWDALGPELQQKVQTYVEAHIEEVSSRYVTFDEASIAAAKDYGVKFVTLPEAEKVKYREIARAAWDDLAKLDPRAEEAMDIHWEFVKSKGRA